VVKTKLSIAIPIYNGELTLAETLDSIINQLSGTDVEIVISDNASTDNTKNIISEYKKIYSHISYYANETNLGPDMNFNLAVKRSNGEYVWLFSDDDIMREGAIKAVLNVLNTNEGLSATFVNWSNYSNDLKTCNVERTIPETKDKLFNNHNEYIETVKLNSIFLSSNIIQKKLWAEKDSKQYVGTFWIQYAKVLDCIINRKSYFIAEPYVSYRSGSTRWKKVSKNNICLGLSLMKILKKLKEKGYSERSLSYPINVIIQDLPRAIVELKLIGLPYKGFSIWKLIKAFWGYNGFWIKTVPLLLTPSTIFIIFNNNKNKTMVKSIFKLFYNPK
jgi:abequosyltransferase